MKYLNTSVKEVLEWAEKQRFFFFSTSKKIIIKEELPSNNYTIIEVKRYSTSALLEYLKFRKVENQTAF